MIFKSLIKTSLVPLGIFVALLAIGNFSVAQKTATSFPLTKYSPRLELTLKGGNTRSMGRLGGVIPIVETNRGLLFSNIFGLLDSQNAQEGNFGLGYRHIFNHDYIIGGYAFYDHRRSGIGNKFNQITIGSEYLRENFESRVNVYLPMGKKEYSFAPQAVLIPNSNYVLVKRSTEQGEKILHGFDVEVGGNLPSFKPLEGYITYYHFNSSNVKPVHGVRFRTNLKLNEYISFEGEVSHDRLRKEQTGKDIVIFGGIKLNYTFGKKKEPLARLEQKMTQMVIRDIDAITDNYKKVSDQENIYIDSEGHVYRASEVDSYIESAKKAKEQSQREEENQNDPKKAKARLKLKDNASFADARYAYKQLSRKYHPDKNDQLGEAKKAKREEKYKEVQHALKVLEEIHKNGEWHKSFALTPSSVEAQAALQPSQDNLGAYTDNFFVVEQKVRKDIQGIIVNKQGNKAQASLIPQGLPADFIRDSKQGLISLIDVKPIQQQLISVNSYDVSGIPSNLPHDKLLEFVKENKWEVKQLIDTQTGRIDYKVTALGLRLRGGMPGGTDNSFGASKKSYKGIFDGSIYKQELLNSIAGVIFESDIGLPILKDSNTNMWSSFASLVKQNFKKEERIDAQMSLKISDLLTDPPLNLKDAKEITQRIMAKDKLIGEISDVLSTFAKDYTCLISDHFEKQKIHFSDADDTVISKINESINKQLNKVPSKQISDKEKNAVQNKLFNDVKFNLKSHKIHVGEHNKKKTSVPNETLKELANVAIERFISLSMTIGENTIFTKKIDEVKDKIQENDDLSPESKKEIIESVKALAGNTLISQEKIREELTKNDKVAQRIDDDSAKKIGTFLAENINKKMVFVDTDSFKAQIKKHVEEDLVNSIAEKLQESYEKSMVYIEDVPSVKKIILDASKGKIDDNKAAIISKEIAQNYIENKNVTLKVMKLAKIQEHFHNQLRKSNEYHDFVKENRSWFEVGNDLAPDFFSLILSYFVHSGTVANTFMEQFFSKSPHKEVMHELKKKIEDLKETQRELEDGVEKELASVRELEKEYILNKNKISCGLQRAIEEMLMQVRNEKDNLQQKLDFVRNALDLPWTHKKINPIEALNRFDNDSFFDAFNVELKNELRAIVHQISINSMASEDDCSQLRVTSYFDGLPGCGKSSSAKHIATNILKVPYYEKTVSDILQLTDDETKGVREWTFKVGWLSEALMQTTDAGERFSNGILVLNDFDNVLFSHQNTPNPSAYAFLLNILDTDLKSFYSFYFKALILMGRLNILVTANNPIPHSIPQTDLPQNNSPSKSEKSEMKNPFGALLSRVTTVYFSPFEESKLANFTEEYLEMLLCKYKFSEVNGERSELKKKLIEKAFELQREFGGANIELRDLRKRLDKLVLNLDLMKIDPRYSLGKKFEVDYKHKV